MEHFVDIVGYESFYQINKLGCIRSLDREIKCLNKRYIKRSQILKQRDRNGYLSVQLSRNGIYKTFYTHRLLAIHFLDKVDGKNFINHKNGIRTDNRIENLEWVTVKENNDHANFVLCRDLYFTKKNCITSKKLNKNKVIKIKKMLKDGVLKQKEIGDLFGVSYHAVSSIKNKRSWINV